MKPKIRIGNGFDFHKIEAGNGMMLGGVWTDCPFEVIAHSDGDVILHTLVDAILGALAMGDIGTLFPDNDSQWKGANSTIFLKKALEIMHEKRYTISNIDLTVICEHPKIKPIRTQIVENLQTEMNLEEGQVSLKATTTEKMGFLGRGEGIGCFATVCLVYES